MLLGRVWIRKGNWRHCAFQEINIPLQWWAEMRVSFHTTMIGVLLFLQIAHLKSWADELKTRDGKTLHGAVKLLDGDIVQVGETRMPLNNVQRLALDQPQAPPDEVRKSADEFWAVRQAGALSWKGTTNCSTCSVCPWAYRHSFMTVLQVGMWA